MLVVWHRYFVSVSPCTTFFFPHLSIIVSLRSRESLWSFIRRSRQFVSHIHARIFISVSRFLKRPSRFPLRCRAYFAISGVCVARPSQPHLFQMHSTPPNKTLEATAVGAGSSAIAVHVASRRWLSFFR